MTQPFKVAIADDHPIFREGLEMILEDQEDLEVVISAEGGGDLLKKLATEDADIVLLDHSMPDMDGFETLQKLREGYPNLKVIVLTMHNDQPLIIKYMKAGAVGYLLKEEKPATILESLRKARTGKKVLPQYAADAILNGLNEDQTPGADKVSSSPNNEFTPREKEILSIIGKKDRQKLAAHFSISMNTIDYHLKNLREKTGCSSTPELVYWAIRNGYQNS